MAHGELLRIEKAKESIFSPGRRVPERPSVFPEVHWRVMLPHFGEDTERRNLCRKRVKPADPRERVFWGSMSCRASTDP